MVATKKSPEHSKATEKYGIQAEGSVSTEKHTTHAPSGLSEMTERLLFYKSMHCGVFFLFFVFKKIMHILPSTVTFAVKI